MNDAGFRDPDPCSVSPFERVQAAQLNRTAQAMRLTDSEVMAAFRAMPADRAFRLAHQALSETNARAMQAAHERKV